MSTLFRICSAKLGFMPSLWKRFIMRNWDDEEKKNEKFDGMQSRDEIDHEHEFHGGRCFHCNKTREEIRKSEWG